MKEISIRFQDIKIIPLIETPLAINNLNKIAKNEKVIGLSWSR